MDVVSNKRTRKHTFEERNHIHKPMVTSLTLPLRKNNSVFRMRADMLGVGIKDDDLGWVSIEVRDIL